MSAERLREAAALMRERAEAATPGPWSVPAPDDEYVGPADVVGDGEPGERYVICEHAGFDATHIASWHPAVALAVADWLEVASEGACCDDCMNDPQADPFRYAALVVANAYLGTTHA